MYFHLAVTMIFLSLLNSCASSIDNSNKPKSWQVTVTLTNPQDNTSVVIFSTTVTDGFLYEIPPDPDVHNEEYMFDGWYSASSNVRESEPIEVVNDIDLISLWKNKTECKIYYDFMSYDEVNLIESYKCSTFVEELPSAFTQSNKFIGWSRENDETAKYNIIHTPFLISESHTLYAVWRDMDSDFSVEYTY